jgi:hypothetical protein
MHLIKAVRLFYTFYKSFALASLLVTSCCLVLFWQYGLGIIVGLLWFKAATLAVLFYFVHLYKQKEYFYYQNLGLSKRLLWFATLGFDFTLFIFLLTQVHHLQ